MAKFTNSQGKLHSLSISLFKVFAQGTHPTKEWAVRGEMRYITKKKLKKTPCDAAWLVLMMTASAVVLFALPNECIAHHGEIRERYYTTTQLDQTLPHSQ